MSKTKMLSIILNSMFKKVIILGVFLASYTPFFGDDPYNFGLSLGFFYTDNDFMHRETNIESQVDSITLFMANMKFGILFRSGYSIDKYVDVGLESGVLFNSYHQNFPVRLYGKLGTVSLNIKPIVGLSYIREAKYMGYGMQDIGIGFSVDYGARLEIFHVYFEALISNSLSSNFLDSKKISFGYSLFFPNIR